MDVSELRPGLLVKGSLERIDPVRRGKSQGGEEIPGFKQVVVQTFPGYRMRATFNEYDKDTGELTSVWRALQGVPALGQDILLKVAADVRQFRAVELMRVLDEIRSGAGIEALRGLVAKWINYRALSVVWLAASAESGR